MSINEEKSWESEAKYNLELCCESACDKFYAQRYITYLENKIKQLEERLSGYERSEAAVNNEE